MTEFGLEPFVINEIKRTLRQFPQVKSAGIYGSRAKGTFKNASDIDLAIHAPGISERDFARLHFELTELPIIFKMDITHVDTLVNKELLEKIRRDEKQIYPDQLAKPSG